MLTVNLGPFPVPITLLLTMATLLLAAAVGRLAGRGRQTGIGNTLIDKLIAAMLVALSPSGSTFTAARLGPCSISATAASPLGLE